MKSTGIIRRIDDLGRIVIPKEVRRTLSIREGDPLEIFLDNGGVVLKKYVPLGDISSQTLATYNALKNSGIKCAIYDNNGMKVHGSKELPYEIDIDELEETGNRYVPIRSENDVVGYIITTTEANEIQKACVKMAAQILSSELGE
jgi:AbrB family looped-hinge helix DNA binding protein